jgi:hypothetical protein
MPCLWNSVTFLMTNLGVGLLWRVAGYGFIQPNLRQLATVFWSLFYAGQMWTCWRLFILYNYINFNPIPHLPISDLGQFLSSIVDMLTRFTTYYNDSVLSHSYVITSILWQELLCEGFCIQSILLQVSSGRVISAAWLAPALWQFVWWHWRQCANTGHINSHYGVKPAALVQSHEERIYEIHSWW